MEMESSSLECIVLSDCKGFLDVTDELLCNSLKKALLETVLIKSVQIIPSNKENLPPKST